MKRPDTLSAADGDPMAVQPLADSLPPDCDVAQVVTELRRLRDEAHAGTEGRVAVAYHEGRLEAFSTALRLLAGKKGVDSKKEAV